MSTVKLQWSNLLKLTELEFRPDFPAQLVISDEVLQCISWLTGTTGFDRRLLRCTPQGALLVAKPWSLMHVAEIRGLYPQTGDPDLVDNFVENKGILLCTSTGLVRVGFQRKSGDAFEELYVPPGQYYWYPYSCYGVKAYVEPAESGTASYIGVTVFN